MSQKQNRSFESFEERKLKMHQSTARLGRRRDMASLLGRLSLEEIVPPDSGEDEQA